jgi:glycosyltransferase involved in cell wall biosynthesis
VAKIVFLLTQSLDSPSGLGRYFPLAKQLVKFDHDVTIYALHPSYDELAQKSLQVDGVYINYVSAMHVKKSADLKSYYSGPKLIQITMRSTWELTKSAIKHNADIIIIGKPHPMNSVAGLIARIIHGSDLFLDCDDYEAGSGRFNSRWQKSIISSFEKWMPKRVNSVLTNTFFMLEKLISWGVNPDKIIYLSNGVDSSRFRAPDRQELISLRQELGLEGKKVIGYIGSLSLPSHPVNLLLEAIQQMHEHDADIRLLLVGGGEDLPTLKKLAHQSGISNITLFSGRVPPEKIPLYYSLLDVSVDPVYDDEAAKGRSPLKLFESWVCCVPFITSDVGDRRTLLGQPEAGVLVPPGDPNSLAKGIRSIIMNPDLANELRMRGEERVKSYTWDRLSMNVNREFQIRTAQSRNE